MNLSGNAGNMVARRKHPPAQSSANPSEPRTEVGEPPQRLNLN